MATNLIDSLDAGYALPSDWYTDVGLYERERALILHRSWQFVGQTGDLSETGDRITSEVCGVPVVLIRRTPDEICGFVNICGNRTHPVARGPGRSEQLDCSCGSIYDLQGIERQSPSGTRDVRDGSKPVLAPIQVAVWGPMIWANLDADAQSFDAWTNGLPDLVASHGVEIEEHVHTLEREWTIRANWKVFLDNAVECYHCPTCHPALSQVIETDPDLHVTTPAGPYRITSETPFKNGAWQKYYGMDQSLDNGAEPLYRFHWIFPTTYLQYKGSADFEIGTIRPLAVDEISFRHMIFMPVDTSEEAIARRKLSLDTGTTVDEDIAICERVQIAHRAAAVPPGRLLPRSEEAVIHFQRTILETMSGARA